MAGGASDVEGRRQDSVRFFRHLPDGWDGRGPDGGPGQDAEGRDWIEDALCLLTDGDLTKLPAILPLRPSECALALERMIEKRCADLALLDRKSTRLNSSHQ